MTVEEEKRAFGNQWGEEEELTSIFRHAGEELGFDLHPPTGASSALTSAVWKCSGRFLYCIWNSCLRTVLEEDSVNPVSTRITRMGNPPGPPVKHASPGVVLVMEAGCPSR